MIPLLLTLISQTPAIEVAVDPTQPWWAYTIQIVVPLLGGVFVWLVKHYGSKVAKFVEAKTGSHVLGEIAHKFLVVALSVYQSDVRQLKKEGKWNPETQLDVKQKAIRAAQLMLNKDQLIKAAGELGLDEFCNHQLESAVAKAKQLNSVKNQKGVPQPDPTNGSAPQ
jgi:hypothetical protein